ncbi:hypothetical protein ACFQ08_02160 [Streptosporangium algeriense]|uniref:Uncharacterized protein n=1 Tax=Streptosporangium algeriense TaxID=1682748 RepID=A0ABW3DJJ5_9ACTN
MTDTGSITVDHDGYINILSHSATIFDLDARLPNQVFNEDMGESLFCEFDAVLAPYFWPALCAMARWHGDKHVELLVLEPDCDTFFLLDGGMYPAMSLSVEADEDDYWAVIGHEPNGGKVGSISLSSRVITITGPSGKWGCWGERDPEVAIFRGFPNATVRDEWRAEFGPFLEVAGALESYLPFTFRGWTVPDEYAATLTANYGPSTSKRP